MLRRFMNWLLHQLQKVLGCASADVAAALVRLYPTERRRRRLQRNLAQRLQIRLLLPKRIFPFPFSQQHLPLSRLRLRKKTLYKRPLSVRTI